MDIQALDQSYKANHIVFHDVNTIRQAIEIIKRFGISTDKFAYVHNDKYNFTTCEWEMSKTDVISIQFMKSDTNGVNVATLSNYMKTLQIHYNPETKTIGRVYSVKNLDGWTNVADYYDCYMA
jgi:hypothetical protein